MALAEGAEAVTQARGNAAQQIRTLWRMGFRFAGLRSHHTMPQ